MQKILIIQTAFIGDVVLSTCIIEKLHGYYPGSQIDFLLRKGNESLLTHHPYVHKILLWDKKKKKIVHLLRLLQRIRKERYDLVVNVQRFAATGFLTAFSRARKTVGFDKNPFSAFFSERISHVAEMDNSARHEIKRNLDLVRKITDDNIVLPKLYPTPEDFQRVTVYQQTSYITVAPASVWFTKQYPADQWIRFIDQLPEGLAVLLLGAPQDEGVCQVIEQNTRHSRLVNLCGKLTILQSCALMKKSRMNFVNDSAPMHFASAMNAPVAAIFCSTVPAFGYGPLSDKKFIIELGEALYCRPCGLHGYKSCPEKHFLCAKKIKDEQLLKCLE